MEHGPSGKECMNRNVSFISASLISPAYKCGPIETVKYTTECFFSSTERKVNKTKQNENEAGTKTAYGPKSLVHRCSSFLKNKVKK